MDGWVGCQIGRGLRALPLTLHTCAQVRNKDVEGLLHEKLEGNAERYPSLLLLAAASSSSVLTTATSASASAGSSVAA